MSNAAEEPTFRSDRQPLVATGKIDCHAADLTATISATMKLSVAQSRLAKFDQWIPIDGDAATPVGQLVEQNSSGPLRLGYGAWRDLLLGCQFQIGTGELITAGGRTMKNVAGYDLTKFMVGQRGVFGKIVTITLRTYRRPAAALVAEFPPSDQFIGQIITTPLRPRWAILSAQSLRCGWLDEPAAIDLFESLATKHRPLSLSRRSLEEDKQDRASLWQTQGDHLRAAIPPAKLLAFAQQANLQHWVADAMFGILLSPLQDIDRALVERAARAAGGSATFIISGQPQWQPTDAEAAVLLKLKNAFDPDGRLTPLSSTPA